MNPTERSFNENMDFLSLGPICLLCGFDYSLFTSVVLPFSQQPILEHITVDP